MLRGLGLTFTLAILITGTRCLRNVKLEIIPDVVELGQEAILKCHYDLEDTQLYSLKWYRGPSEFYRYSPGENPKIKIFNHTWIQVDPRNSDESQVAIKNVKFQLTGNFSCEVTTDAPLFSTASSSKFLNVVSIPKGKPVIKTERERYERGDTLRANCSTPPSKPPAKFTFTLNGFQIEQKHTKQSGGNLDRRTEHNSVMDTSRQHRSGESNNDDDDFTMPRHRQWARLTLDLKDHYFNGFNGQLNLKCNAKIPGIYENWNEIQIGGSGIKEPVPARVTSSKSSSYHRVADLTILGLIILHLHLR